MVALLDAVTPFADGIRQACRTLGLQACVTLVIEAHGYRDGDELIVSSAAISYSGPTIQRLAELGARLDHDQYLDIR